MQNIKNLFKLHTMENTVGNIKDQLTMSRSSKEFDILEESVQKIIEDNKDQGVTVLTEELTKLLSKAYELGFQSGLSEYKCLSCESDMKEEKENVKPKMNQDSSKSKKPINKNQVTQFILIVILTFYN